MTSWSLWVPSVTVGLISLIAAVTSAFAHKRRSRTITATQVRLFEEVRQEVAEAFPDEHLLAQVLSTSTAHGPVGVAEGPSSIAQLRQQISVIEQKIQDQRNEIVEVSKIDPVLEATIKASIDNL